MKVLFVCGRHNYGDPQRGLGYEYANMLPAIAELGHECVFFESWDKSAYESFADLNRRLLDKVAQEQPDAVFFVLMNYEIWIETLDAIRQQCGAVAINWAPDDSWKFRQSSRFFLDHVDIHCTTCPTALTMARAATLGAESPSILLTQWAANSAALAAPRAAKDCPISVSFVGTAYGNRRKWISGLRQRGIEVTCFGHGWPGGAISETEVKEVIRNSIVTLNFADSGLLLEAGRLRRSRQIKARTFEVPGAGGFLLTETADRLHEFYEPDTELVAFTDVDDLAAKIRYFLAHPAARDAIAKAAFERTAKSHTYEQRLRTVFAEAERIRTRRIRQRRMHACSGSADWMTDLARVHTQDSWALRLFKASLLGPARLGFGTGRGPRAARRFLYEVYWRVAGERTYRASGLPGRLFYRES